MDHGRDRHRRRQRGIRLDPPLPLRRTRRALLLPRRRPAHPRLALADRPQPADQGPDRGGAEVTRAEAYLAAEYEESKGEVQRTVGSKLGREGLAGVDLDAAYNEAW